METNSLPGGKLASANYWTGKLARGGELRLEASSLIFEPHSVERSLGAKPIEIPLVDIASAWLTASPINKTNYLPLPKALCLIGYYATFPMSRLFMGKGSWLKVDTVNGPQLFLVNSGHVEWIEAISSAAEKAREVAKQ